MARVAHSEDPGAAASRPAYLVDTPALARYLGGDLPSALEPIFDDGEKGRAILLLPEIVLAEFIASCSNGRLRVDHPKIVLEQVLKEVWISPIFTPAPMDQRAWQVFLHTDLKRPADRLLVALARAHGAKAILTSNPALKRTYPSVW